MMDVYVDANPFEESIIVEWRKYQDMNTLETTNIHEARDEY